MSMWETIQGLGAAAGGLAYASKISDKGDQYSSQMGDLAGQLAKDSAFKGYGVKTGLGESSVAADGSMELGVGPNTTMGTGGESAYNAGLGHMQTGAMAMQNNSTNPYAQQAMAGMQASGQGVAGMQAGSFGAQNQFMNQAMGGTAGREQDIYNRAMAMQQPGLDAQRAQGNAQEFAAGRGGVMGSQFGGSGEDAAMARAQAGAMNQASFQAMGQANQEQMNQAQMSNMFGQQGMAGANFQQNNAMGMNQMGMQNAQLGQAGALGMANIGGQQAGAGMQGYQNQYLPMQQQLNAMGVAQNGASMAQTGQLTGAGYGAQLGLGGIQTQVNADKAASELYGNTLAAMMNNANAGSEASWLGGLFGADGLFGGS